MSFSTAARNVSSPRPARQRARERGELVGVRVGERLQRRGGQFGELLEPTEGGHDVVDVGLRETHEERQVGRRELRQRVEHGALLPGVLRERGQHDGDLRERGRVGVLDRSEVVDDRHGLAQLRHRDAELGSERLDLLAEGGIPGDGRLELGHERLQAGDILGQTAGEGASVDGSVEAICSSTVGGRSTKRSSPPSASTPATTSADVRPTSTLSCCGVSAASSDSSGRGSRASCAISGSARAAAASLAGEASANGAVDEQGDALLDLGRAQPRLLAHDPHDLSVDGRLVSAGGAGGQCEPVHATGAGDAVHEGQRGDLCRARASPGRASRQRSYCRWLTTDDLRGGIAHGTAAETLEQLLGGRRLLARQREAVVVRRVQVAGERSGAHDDEQPHQQRHQGSLHRPGHGAVLPRQMHPPPHRTGTTTSDEGHGRPP
jgi:hypothetical protein